MCLEAVVIKYKISDPALMIDRAEPNLTTTQLYNTENHYPPRVSIAPSRPSLLPLVTGRSVSVVGMSCNGSPCAPLHTLHRCGSIHSRGRRNTHHSTLPRPLCSPCSPLLLLVWASAGCPVYFYRNQRAFGG